MIPARNVTGAHAQDLLARYYYTSRKDPHITLNYKLLEMLDAFGVCSSRIPLPYHQLQSSISPIVNTLRTAPHMPTLQGSDHFRVCQLYLKFP